MSNDNYRNYIKHLGSIVRSMKKRQRQMTAGSLSPKRMGYLQGPRRQFEKFVATNLRTRPEWKQY